MAEEEEEEEEEKGGQDEQREEEEEVEWSVQRLKQTTPSTVTRSGVSWVSTEFLARQK